LNRRGNPEGILEPKQSRKKYCTTFFDKPFPISGCPSFSDFLFEGFSEFGGRAIVRRGIKKRGRKEQKNRAKERGGMEKNRPASISILYSYYDEVPAKVLETRQNVIPDKRSAIRNPGFSASSEFRLSPE